MKCFDSCRKFVPKPRELKAVPVRLGYILPGLLLCSRAIRAGLCAASRVSSASPKSVHESCRFKRVFDAIALSLFVSRLEAVCDEMGVVLRNAALSTNIRDRLDFSCAVFDNTGALCAQAAHIPVHLGSMAFAMADLVGNIDWVDGDMIIVNDPYLGGTHLPDVTIIAPVYAAGELVAFVANRAHHADIGASSPGSMPISQTLAEEGLVIEPCHLLRGDQIQQNQLTRIIDGTRNPDHTRGDFFAQISANRTGRTRLSEFVRRMGVEAFRDGLIALNDYGERLARAALAEIPDGTYSFTDLMDDDGQGNFDLAICVTLRVCDGNVECDFSGTAAAVDGNINCPLAVAAAATFYCFRCLMPPHTPACAGSLRPIKLHAPEGCWSMHGAHPQWLPAMSRPAHVS